MTRLAPPATRRALFILHPSSLILPLYLLVAYPLLSGGLPTVGDGLIHFYRFSQLDWQVRHGDLYPRWFANLHYGFGAPVLNFYAPLSYYVPLLFRLFNLSLPTCLLLGYALALAVALWGAYHWVADQTASPLAGLTAAAAYSLAPYLYLDIFHRGAYPELWGLALAPWLLWAARRAARGPTARALFALLLSALILTHTLTALLFAPIAFLYLLLSPREGRATLAHWARAARTMAHGIALSAFFTLPVLLESKYVQLFRTFLPGDLDYRRNFLTLAALFAAPPNFDPRLVFNAMPASLPWPQLAVAAGGWLWVVGGWWLAVSRRQPVGSGQWAVGNLSPRRAAALSRPLPFVIFHSSLFIAFSLLTLSASSPLWSLFPFARFIQFPWRLVGPASLFLAAVAGAGMARFQTKTFGVWLFGFGISSFFLFSLPWTYHIPFDSLPSAVTPADSIRYEIATGQLGATSTGEYLPRWVEQLPDPNTLLPSYAQTDLPSHLVPLPSDITLHVSRSTLHTETLTYTSPTPFTATFNLFYFPGWGATLDGRPAVIRVTAPGGLISVPAPAGTHTLILALRPTAPQVAGSLISLASFVILLLAALNTQYPIPNTDHDSRITAYSLIVSLFVVSLFIARILYFDRFDTPFHHTDFDSLPNPIAVNFGDQLELIGSQHPATLVSGGTLPVTLYWRALARRNSGVTADYAVTVQLADRFGNRFGLADSQHPGRVPTSRWQPGQYARDLHALASLPGTPPGSYHLLVGVYAASPLSVMENGAPSGASYDLGQVAITRAAPQPPGPLAIVHVALARETLTVGDPLELTVTLDSGSAPPLGLRASLTLTGPAGNPIFNATLPPAGLDYPSDQWTPDELIRFPYSVGLPPRLPPGPAMLTVALLLPSGGQAAPPFAAGQVALLVPQRSFVIPPMTRRVNHDFADSIRLLGYTLEPGGITLYWQSLRPVSARLTVFVHRLGADGALLAGSDAPPARPTAGWLPGEVLTDPHPIAVGDRFEIGLYDPTTGERFGDVFATAP